MMLSYVQIVIHCSSLSITGLRTNFFNKYCNYVFPHVCRRWLGAVRTRTKPIVKRRLFCPEKQETVGNPCNSAITFVYTDDVEIKTNFKHLG